jgi:hypothetical protein
VFELYLGLTAADYNEQRQLGSVTVAAGEPNPTTVAQAYLLLPEGVQDDRYVHVVVAGEEDSVAAFRLDIRELETPDQWSCEADQKKVRVEISAAGQWIEIPTTEVELYENKGKDVGVVRTARVMFPQQWAGESVSKYLSGFTPENPEEFNYARIYFKDAGGNWWLKHFGFVGGVGAAAQDNVGKCFVYDLSRLLNGKAVSLSFDDAQPAEIVNSTAEVIVDETPAPVIQTLVWQLGTDERIGPRIDDIDTSAAAVNPPSGSVGTDLDAAPSIDISLDESPASSGPGVETTSDTILGEQQPSLSKTFTENHDTIIDVLNWVAKKTDGEWWLQPMQYGVNLVLNLFGGGPKKQFIQREATQRNDFESVDDFRGEYRVTNIVDVLENNVLYDVQPNNTVQVRGVANTTYGGDAIKPFEDAYDYLSSGSVTREYPVVVATSPELVEAAGGMQLQPRVIESNATTLDEAENEAITELQNELASAGEGTIRLRSAPRVSPYDKVDAFETCGEYISELSSPVPYEIESVVHRQSSGGLYDVEAEVSIYSGREQINIARSTMVQVQS